jgi:hypothetical protein
MNNFPKSLNFFAKIMNIFKNMNISWNYEKIIKEVDKANRKIKTGKENMKEKNKSDKNK